MRPLPSTLLIAAGLLSLSAGAIAQPPGPQPMQGPGSRGPMPGPMMPITRVELQARLTQMFDRLDANKDGKLSPEDRQAHKQQVADKRFDRIDADKDGSISRQEFAALPAPHGRKAGGMRPAAMMAGPDGPPRFGPGGPDARRMMMRPAMMPPMQGPRAEAPISKADFIAKGLARFDQVDTDHDGTISPAEHDAARDTMRDRRGGAMMPLPRPQTERPGQ
jgi:hypothetical protein